MDAFQKAIYFCGRDAALAPVRAGSAILAAKLAGDLGDRALAREILVSAAGDVPDCAELLLAAARETGDADYLRRALWLAPELATFAALGNLGDATSVAEQVASDPQSPVSHMRSAVGHADNLGLPVEKTNGLPELMSSHRAWRNGLAAQLSAAGIRETEWVRQAELQAESATRQMRDLHPPRTSGRGSTRGVLLNVLAAGLAVAAVATFFAMGGGLVGVFVALIFAAPAFWALWSGSEAIDEANQAAQRNEEQRANYERSYRQASAHDQEKRRALADARKRCIVSEAMLEDVEHSLPKRTFPLTAPAA
jgi:hypothetical protein